MHVKVVCTTDDRWMISVITRVRPVGHPTKMLPAVPSDKALTVNSPVELQ